MIYEPTPSAPPEAKEDSDLVKKIDNFVDPADPEPEERMANCFGIIS
jgi:hypothetical protein